MIPPRKTPKSLNPKSPPGRPLDLKEILQSLRLVLEMEPEHLDGAIDLLDEAIHNDRKKPASFPPE